MQITQQASALDDTDQRQDRADYQHTVHVPFGWAGADLGIVESDQHDRHIIQQRQQDDHHGGQNLGGVNNGYQHDKDHDVNSHRNSVVGVPHHALEGATCLLDSADDH